MSITFSLVTSEGNLACTVDHGACVVAEHLLDEDIMAYSFEGYCVECSLRNRDACELCGSSLNVSNSNAFAILAALGIELDDCGTIEASDLLGRAMVSGVGRDDSGTADVVDGRMVDCGLRAGYFADRFGALADLATLAIERGYSIQFC